MLIWRDSHDNDVPCIELHAHTTAIVRLCKRRVDCSYEISLSFVSFYFHQKVKLEEVDCFI